MLDNEKKELSGLAFKTDDLFEAVDTLINSRIQKLEYDQTVEAKIVSTTQKAEGIYKVEYQSAIFDAYANDSSSYYNNEMVYVMIPKGDFTKQKYIVGRITGKDSDDNTSKTFNFKLPFDNFVGLENLMTNNPMIPVQYLANKPTDGLKNDVADTSFLNQLSGQNASYTAAITEVENKMRNLDLNLAAIKNMLKAKAIDRAGSTLNQYQYTSNQTLLEALKTQIKILAGKYNETILENALDTYWSWFRNQRNTDVTIPNGDYDTLWTIARSEHDRQYSILTGQYNTAVENARQAVNSLFNNSIYSTSNSNHIWSWSRSSQNPVIETKLGIGVDFKVLLGNYRPSSGDYGLRILISGRTKPTEEKNSEEVTEEVYLKTSDMYGNVYAFYEPYTQQKIFDISHFVTLNRIDIFFWQDHNFVAQNGTYIPYQSAGKDLPANILLSGLDVKLGLTTDECQTDRVFLYTYDDVYYGYDPLEDTPRAADEKEERILNFAWVHIGPDGPVLVNHIDYYPANNTKDQAALQYWIDNGGAQIQWYHFEYGCAQDTTQLAERQGGASWKYLGEYNPSISGKDYKGSQFSISVIPDIKKAKDKWKAVVSVGNVPYSAEPLVFTNRDTRVESESFDSLNEVVFRILHEEFSDQANQFNIVEDNQLRDFYVYDINGYAIKNENNRLYSDIDYYLQVWIRNNDTGEYLPMTYDPDDGLVEVEFTWPQGRTMIRDWSEVALEDLSRAELAPLLAGASEQYNQRIKDITRKFHINNLWEANKNNNTVSATVKRRGKTYHPSIQFNFGSSSSMGTDYVLTVSQTAPGGSMLVKDQQFTIEANVKQKAAAKDPNSKYIFTWELLSPTVITQSGNENWSEGQASSWTVDNSNGFLGNVIQGYVRNDYPPIFKVTVRNAADYPISQTAGFRLAQNANIASKYVVNSCAERVEFKSDGAVPISYYGTFSVQVMKDDGSIADTWPEWTMSQMRKSGGNWSLLDSPDYFGIKETTTVARSMATNTNGTIYAAGTSNMPNLDGPFSSSATSACLYPFVYQNIYNAINQTYDETIANALSDSSSNIEQVKADAEYVRTRRLNDLNLAASKQLPAYKSYQFNPYTKNDINATTWMWEDKLEKNYYTFIGFTVYEGYFKQAVPFTRNVYSSTLLNSWDGKLFLDEENNAVMSQMVSAGTKSTTDGTFTGVVMGNWAGVSDTSLDIPGLYGLKDGGQVFGFKTDGSGFIGKSGRGRIVFDGNQSLISNVDRTSYINLDPIRYHYDGSSIVFDDYKGYSQFFLYSEAKKTSTASLLGEDSLEQSTYWAKKYMDDTLKDYFIVDPNNGILTSGGVIARYGKIGNWLISESGIYQKYTAPANSPITANRYMYLGYPGVSDAEINAAKSAYASQIASIEARRKMAIDTLTAEYLMEAFQVVGEYYKNIFELDPMHYFNCGWPYYSYIQAIQATLDTVNSETSREDIRDILEANLKEFIEAETRSGYHRHYDLVNGEYVKNSGTPYTGDRYVFDRFMVGMTVTQPSFGSQTLQNIADTNEYPPGYQRTVTFDNNTVSNNKKSIPYDTVTYYGNTWSGEYNTKWGAIATSTYTFHAGDLSTFTIPYLQNVLSVATGLYNYFLDAYTRQIQAGLEAGYAQLAEEQKAEYNKQKAKILSRMESELQKLNEKYDELLTPINNLINQAVKALYDADKNRYAIYAGYNAPGQAGGVDPLFTVNWRGYMTARAGKIGTTSPWYISDEGLTQKNNSGTIFLGNPNSRSDGRGWTDLGLSNDMDNLSEILLPNDATITQDANGNNQDLRGPAVFGDNDRGQFAIYAGGLGKVWSYNSESKKWMSTNETKPTIKFGVRMDGTLYASRGLVGGWYIANNMLYAGSPDGSGDFLVLDAVAGVINLNNAVVLEKTGVVTLGTMVSDGQGGLQSSGIINIAGVIFKGKNTGHVNMSRPNYEFNSDSATISTGESYNFWGSTRNIGSATISVQGTSFNSIAKVINYTAQLEINDGAETSTGVVIGFGKEADSSGTETGRYAVAIYPTTSGVLGNSVLGTANNPWDIIGDVITCNNLQVSQGNLLAKNIFMKDINSFTAAELANADYPIDSGDIQKDHLVATQFWVRWQLQDVYAQIKSASSGGSSAGQRALAAGRSLAGSISALEQLLAQMIDGTDFLQSTDGSATIEMKDSKILFKVSKYEITSWTDPEISSGESGDTTAVGSGNVVESGTHEIILSGWRINWRYGFGGAGSIYDVVKSINTTFDADGLTGKFDGTTLKWALKTSGSQDDSAGINAAWTANLSHNHELTFQEPSGQNGTVSFEIGEANFPPAATGNSATFDVTATTWYTSQTLDLETGHSTSSNAAYITLYNSSAKTWAMPIAGTYGVSLSEDVAGKKVLLNHNNNQICEIDTTPTFNDGYKAGWNAAVQSISTASGGTDGQGRAVTYVVGPKESDGSSYGTKNIYKYSKSVHSISTTDHTNYYTTTGPIFASTTYVFYGSSSDPANASESTHSRKGDLYTRSSAGTVTQLNSHSYVESSFGSA